MSLLERQVMYMTIKVGLILQLVLVRIHHAEYKDTISEVATLQDMQELNIMIQLYIKFQCHQL